MNAQRKNNAESIKNNISKSKKFNPVKFDKEGFFLAWGIGIVCAGIGILIVWATKTAPKGPSKTMVYTFSQRVTRLLPESTKETLAFIMGSLFVLFGVICIILGLKLVIQYVVGKIRS